MKALIIVRPAALASIEVSSGAISGNNLLTPNPREAWFAEVAGSVVLDIFLAQPVQLDTAYLGYCALANGATITASTYAVADTASAATALGAFTVDNPTGDERARHVVIQGTARTVQLIRFVITSISAPVVGVVAGGLAWSAQWGHEYGAGRQIGDTSNVERLFDGSFAIDEGATFSGYQWTFGDLQFAERESLQAIVQNRGVGRSFLVVEDSEISAGFNERVHWGLLTKLEAFERLDPQNTKWALRVEDWA